MSYNLYDEIAEYFSSIKDIDELNKEQYDFGVFIQECVNTQEAILNGEEVEGC